MYRTPFRFGWQFRSRFSCPFVCGWMNFFSRTQYTHTPTVLMLLLPGEWSVAGKFSHLNIIRRGGVVFGALGSSARYISMGNYLAPPWRKKIPPTSGECWRLATKYGVTSVHRNHQAQQKVKTTGRRSTTKDQKKATKNTQSNINLALKSRFNDKN